MMSVAICIFFYQKLSVTGWTLCGQHAPNTWPPVLLLETLCTRWRIFTWTLRRSSFIGLVRVSSFFLSLILACVIVSLKPKKWLKKRNWNDWRKKSKTTSLWYYFQSILIWTIARSTYGQLLDQQWKLRDKRGQKLD